MAKKMKRVGKKPGPKPGWKKALAAAASEIQAQPKAKAKAAKAKAKAKPKAERSKLRTIEVKLSIADLRRVNAAVKKSGISKGVWLRDALMAGTDVELGEPTGKHAISPRVSAPIGVIAQGDDIPNAHEDDVAEVEEETQPKSLAAPVLAPAPAPGVIAPAPNVQTWPVALGRVPPPIWQQQPVQTIPAQGDEQPTAPYPNGHPSGQEPR